MRITIIGVGKIKERFFEEAISEYVKRLSKYCKLSIIEIPDEKAPEKLSTSQMKIVKDKEGDRILQKVKDTDYVICLEIEGKSLSSEELSSLIDKIGIDGNSDVTFIIGGSLGLSKNVLNRANFKLSFSRMTFPHQLMRVIALEQIYRAFKISGNEPYHK
jgi:23S rRNA (pseudouridine1915-N3)-methyltransferase